MFAALGIVTDFSLVYSRLPGALGSSTIVSDFSVVFRVEGTKISFLIVELACCLVFGSVYAKFEFYSFFVVCSSSVDSKTFPYGSWMMVGVVGMS